MFWAWLQDSWLTRQMTLCRVQLTQLSSQLIELDSHQLSKGLLSRYSSSLPPPTQHGIAELLLQWLCNACWVWLLLWYVHNRGDSVQGRLSLTPQAQQGFAKPTPDNYVHSTETQYIGYWVWLLTWPLHSPRISVGNAEYGSPHRSLHSPMTQGRKCWVWLSTEASPQLSDSA